MDERANAPANGRKHWPKVERKDKETRGADGRADELTVDRT